MTELRFHLAGLDVRVTGLDDAALADVAPGYRDPAYAARGEPGLEIAVTRVPGLGTTREPGPEYPAFRRERLGDGRIGLRRYDAEGEITVSSAGSTPVRAEFRVGDSANSLEACIRIALSVALPRFGGFILHASAVRHRGQALVFTGVSGAGKSTISEMLDALPEVDKIVDELGILRVGDDGATTLHTAPFLGLPMPRGVRAPVAGFHFLVQAPHHRREPVPARAAVGRLLANVLAYVAEPVTAGHVLELAARLVETTPCYRLEFAKDVAVAHVLGIS